MGGADTAIESRVRGWVAERWEASGQPLRSSVISPANRQSGAGTVIGLLRLLRAEAEPAALQCTNGKDRGSVTDGSAAPGRDAGVRNAGRFRTAIGVGFQQRPA